MNKAKNILLFIPKIINFILKLFSSNKILIKNNKHTKVKDNQINSMDLIIKRNDSCEIYKNKFEK